MISSHKNTPVTQSKEKTGLLTVVAIILFAQVLVFVGGYALGFLAGVYTGGISEGFRLASGIFYSWFAYVILGFITAAICVIVILFKRKRWH
jgi:hypothetical protein